MMDVQARARGFAWKRAGESNMEDERKEAE
jgi:hypothetical protein